MTPLSIKHTGDSLGFREALDSKPEFLVQSNPSCIPSQLKASFQKRFNGNLSVTWNEPKVLGGKGTFFQSVTIVYPLFIF